MLPSSSRVSNFPYVQINESDRTEGPATNEVAAASPDHVIQMGPMPGPLAHGAAVLPLAPANRQFFTDMADPAVLNTLLSYMEASEIVTVATDAELGRRLEGHPVFRNVSDLLPLVRSAQQALNDFQSRYGDDPAHRNAFANPQLVDLYRQVRNAQGCDRRHARTIVALLVAATVGSALPAGMLAFFAANADPGRERDWNVGFATFMSVSTFLSACMAGFNIRNNPDDEARDMATAVAGQTTALEAGLSAGLMQLEAALEVLDPQRNEEVPARAGPPRS